MKEFSEYYTNEKIIKQLCKIRVSYCQRRNKVNLNNKLTTPQFHQIVKNSEYDAQILKELSEILPNRRLWLTKGQGTFLKVKNKTTKTLENINISTEDKNQKILYNTITKYLNKYPETEFVKNLNLFLEDVRKSIENNNYIISSPDIIPEIKEKNNSKLEYYKKHKIKLECRPISRFSLKDRIILSITNKFLTELFDDFFEDSALAFRATKFVDNKIVISKHHQAIEKIISFKKKNIDIDLYVAECDMKKFYDSVDHNKCRIAFDNLIDEIKNKQPTLNLSNAISIFSAYLSCYSFRENVLEKNYLDEYWISQKDKKNNQINGYFPWVKELTNSDDKSKRIGVPQGGALSGLIANIVLDAADKKLKEIDNLFYVRFCDDMILMHKDIDECEKAIKIYTTTIKSIGLFNHDFETVFSNRNKNYLNKLSQERVFETKNKSIFARSYEHSIKLFWNCKSKGPYKWGKFDLANNCFPWIGFVGYEINYKCETRVRKRSLSKELNKQTKTISTIIYLIKKNKNARNNTIIRSAFERLNGMSVGRIKLYNYKTCKNELCWSHGFQQLNFNAHSIRQLKCLDRNKYKQMYILRRELGAETRDGEEPTEGNNSEIYYYHKPFSYYYQVGQKKT